jgi:ribose 1,5-bisphosphate isomerase
MLRNALAAFQRTVKLLPPSEAARKVLSHLDDADGRIAGYTADLNKSGHSYYTHCHSSTVVKAFLEARSLGTKFAVHNTETRPRLQGRKTATELAAAGIPVVHVVDSAARVALKGCNAVFLGADALLSDGTVVNKIGSEMVAELAHNRHIPVYILANSWKYDIRDAKAFKAALEHRDPAEVWDAPPKGVRVVNEAFELVNPKLITGVITEHGIRDPRSTVLEIQRHRSWLGDES